MNFLIVSLQHPKCRAVSDMFMVFRRISHTWSTSPSMKVGLLPPSCSNLSFSFVNTVHSR